MKNRISFQEALGLIVRNVSPGAPEEVELAELNDRILAEDTVALVDSPSLDASLKDGYAVRSGDVERACPEQPVPLRLISFQAAGQQGGSVLLPGTAIRVMTGARLPEGSDAILAGEFAREENGTVWCINTAGPGRNVLFRGTDVRAGQVVANRGERLHPALIGLLAAAGLDRATVFTRPRVAVIGTGDEVVAPGNPLPSGKLYASNITESLAWLNAFGLNGSHCRIVPDRAETIRSVIEEMAPLADAFITSGGAWGSERDLVIQVLEEMKWEGIFHRVRLGPGKAVGFGLLAGKPFFMLPGGPPSHEIGFLLLAFPGLMRMAGWEDSLFPVVKARLEETVTGQADWTQCLHARLDETIQGLTVRAMKTASRLSGMARKDGLIIIPEGVSELTAGSTVNVLLVGGRYI